MKVEEVEAQRKGATYIIEMQQQRKASTPT